MNEQPGLHSLFELVSQHWVSVFFLALTLGTILGLMAVRWWLKRRLKRMFEDQFEEENELDVLPSPGPADRKALELIREMRREIWSVPEIELQLGLDSLNQRAVKIVRAISSVYHPDVEVPQYEASLIESLQLIRRVTNRITRHAQTTPFKYLGNRRLSDFQRYYQVYRKLNDNPLLRLLRRNPHLSRIAGWALNVKNLGNPLYWAGKELSRESYFFLLRWFYLTFTSQVGREAMRLYSGRRFLTEEDRDATLVCYRLFALTLQWGGPSAGEWSVLVDFVTNHAALEPETKIHVLQRCARGKLPKDLDRQRLQTKSGLRWYREGLKQLAGQDSKSPPQKPEIIAKENAALE
jgi:hypothetical protein